MASELEKWIEALNESLTEDHSSKTAALLSLRNRHCFNDALIRTGMSEDEENGIIEQISDEFIAVIAAHHLRVIRFLHRRNLAEAFTSHEQAVLGCIDMLKTHAEDNWAVELTSVLASDLTRLAILVDQESAKSTAQLVDNSSMNKRKDWASELLTQLFRICAGDKTGKQERSKRIAMLPLVNNAVRINFLMDRLQLCAPLIRAIENSGLLDKWGSSELVPYRFYLGQSHMRKGNLKAAEELLSYAFDNCPLRPARNVRLILIYLIPLKLMKGIEPATGLLEEWDLKEYVGLVDAVRQGNFNALREWSAANQTFVHQFKLWFCLEGGLRLIMGRNILRTVRSILTHHIISIPAYARAMTVAGCRTPGHEEMTTTHAEGFIIQLVAYGMVRGYVSRKHQKLVMAKQNTFPQPSLERPTIS